MQGKRIAIAAAGVVVLVIFTLAALEILRRRTNGFDPVAKLVEGAQRVPGLGTPASLPAAPVAQA